jgi:hypothetical protein
MLAVGGGMKPHVVSDALLSCRFLQPMARAARLRGGMVAELAQASTGSCDLPPGPEDDVVVLLEKAKDSNSAALRAEYLCK